MLNSIHRLAVKIEETVLGNGIWDKVTVKIPNSSYKLDEVKHENNKLSVLFIYSPDSAYAPVNFSFMLSAFDITPSDVAKDHEFLVAGIDETANINQKREAVSVFPTWLNSEEYKRSYVLATHENSKTRGKFECPTVCPFV